MKNTSKSEDNVKHLPISDNEKDLLKKKIFNSIQRKKYRAQLLRVLSGIAASIALLLVGLYYYSGQLNTTPSITEYVKQTPHFKQGDFDEVMLILGEGDQHRISEKEKEISYSSTGKDIKVGTSTSLKQGVVDDEKAVFNTLVVPYGRTMKTKLSDGSMVWLNSGSRLVYPAVFAGEKREVYIEGEAIFEVSHDEGRPFHVISDMQIIEVLGTVFSVSNYADDKSISTILKSGSVQITFSNEVPQSSTLSNVKLSPGTKASFNKEDQSVMSEKVDVDTYFSWRKGFIVFNKNDFSYIMRRLSRYYNMDVTITNDQIIDNTFSGYLNLNEDVEKVLQVIQLSTDFEYELEKDMIIIN